MHNYLEKQIGRSMNTKEVDDFLNIDVSTVRRYYKILGGIRLGRTYRFFEKEVQYAIQERSKMDGSGTYKRKTKEEDIPHESRSQRMGGVREKTNTARANGTSANQQSTKGRHGLLD